MFGVWCLVFGGIHQVGAYDFIAHVLHLPPWALYWAHTMASPWQLKSPSLRGRSPFARSRPHAYFLRSLHPSSMRAQKQATAPTDTEQATGLERLQLVGQLYGVDAFDMGPLLITKPGTLADPALVPAYVRSGFCESY